MLDAIKNLLGQNTKAPAQAQAPTSAQQSYNYTWVTPPATILSDVADEGGMEYTGEYIAAVLNQVGISAEHVKTTFGASVGEYHFNVADLNDIRKIKRNLQVISAALHVDVLQGNTDLAHFSLVVPRQNRATVGLKRAMLLNNTYNNMPAHSLSACIGTDTQGKPVCVNIEDLPHLMIAGATGSGKSVLLNSIITSILFKTTPSDLQMILIDPKQVELTAYEGIPQLMTPVITDPRAAIQALNNLCGLMDRRYAEMAVRGLKTAPVSDYPRILVVIDEMADLMMMSRSAVERAILRLAQKGRAAGIHLIIATQRPVVAVITGNIKANIPARIALTTASSRDSMTVLDYGGAEQLTGKGDGLLKLPDSTDTIRFQGAYISDSDIANVVNYWRSNACKRVS